MDHETRLRPALDTFFDVWNSGEYGKLAEALTEDFRRFAPGDDANGRDEMSEVIRRARQAYRDFRIVANEASFSEGLAFCQWTATGAPITDDGTGAPITIEGVAMFRYSGDVISEEHVYSDTAQFEQQTGTSDVPHID
jgi:hypothetical protein